MLICVKSVNPFASCHLLPCFIKQLLSHSFLFCILDYQQSFLVCQVLGNFSFLSGMCLLAVMQLQQDCRWILVSVAVGSVGRVSCCSGWGEDIVTDCLKIFSSYLSKVNGQLVWWLGFFSCFELWCCSYGNSAYFSCS